MTIRSAVSVLLLAASAVFWGQGALLFGKAWLAQRLIASAWQASLVADNPNVKPWAWADTWPVARLRSDHLANDLYILEGADGSSLAFGPGHVSGTALPGDGVSVIGGHRDTHFRFLQDLTAGERVAVQRPTGEWQHFEIVEMRVDDIRKGELPVAASTEQQLVLVTCFPFDDVVPGGPLRYVVTAEPITF